MKIKIACKGASTIPIEKLVEFQGNLKDLSDTNFEKLKKQILNLGFSEPLAVWKKGNKNFVLNGHQRLRVLKKMQAEGYFIPPLPVILVDAKSEKEAKKKVLSLTSQFGEITGQGLYEFMNDADLNFDEIEDFRFPEINLESFNKEFFEEPEVLPPGESDLAEFLEPPKEPKSKLGDLWTLGNHRLFCGDSGLIDSCEKLMSGKIANLVFTDPPYGVSFQSNQRTKSKKFDVLKNDDTILTEWIGNLPLISNGWVFVWTTWKVLNKWIEATKNLGEMTNMVVWDKGGGGMGDLEKTFSTDYEIALVFNRGAKLEGKRIGSVWGIGKDGSSTYLHPTQKPVERAQQAIEHTTKENDLVLDLFGGSGSTLIACEKTKRKCCIMELDPRYVDVILSRWADYTGQDPIRDDGVKWSELLDAK